MDENDRIIGNVIREARKIKGLTQGEVSMYTGISFGEYQRLEYGIRSFGCINIRKGLALCRLLDLDPWLLVFGHSDWV